MFQPPRRQASRKYKSITDEFGVSKQAGQTDQVGTVYSELKLSTKLERELALCRNQMQSLQEQLEESNYERDILNETIQQNENLITQ
tara:strand:- start:50 stop:310 length:261 start_codon:yes stop_codon:yes gene_type:complete